MFDTLTLALDAGQVDTVCGGSHHQWWRHEVTARNQKAHVGVMGKYVMSYKFTEQLNEIGKSLSVNVIGVIIWKIKL